MTENWTRSYAEAPEIFDAFRCAEDPEGRVLRRLEALAGISGRDVVEIGSGTGRTAATLARRARRYVAIEPEPAMLRIARSAAPAAFHVRARGEALPIPTGSVDRVLATWFLANARRAVQRAAEAEAARVLRPGGSLWAVENHWDDEFQSLRGRAGPFETAEVRPLIEEAGFEIVERVSTTIRFASVTEARRVLGWLIGVDRVPGAVLGHDVLILRRGPTQAGRE